MLAGADSADCAAAGDGSDSRDCSDSVIELIGLGAPFLGIGDLAATSSGGVEDGGSASGPDMVRNAKWKSGQAASPLRS